MPTDGSTWTHKLLRWAVPVTRQSTTMCHSVNIVNCTKEMFVTPWRSMLISLWTANKGRENLKFCLNSKLNNVQNLFITPFSFIQAYLQNFGTTLWVLYTVESWFSNLTNFWVPFKIFIVKKQSYFSNRNECKVDSFILRRQSTLHTVLTAYNRRFHC